jgi:CBS domain-containing protein
VMTRGIVSCRADTPLVHVSATMAERDVSAVIVTDDGGRVEGVLSITDLDRAHAAGPHLDPHLPELLPAHLMSRDVLTTWPDEMLENAVHRLLDHRVHRLVVTAAPDDRTAIGVLSASDLIPLLPKEATRGEP